LDLCVDFGMTAEPDIAGLPVQRLVDFIYSSRQATL